MHRDRYELFLLRRRIHILSAPPAAINIEAAVHMQVDVVKYEQYFAARLTFVPYALSSGLDTNTFICRAVICRACCGTSGFSPSFIKSYCPECLEHRKVGRNLDSSFQV